MEAVTRVSNLPVVDSGLKMASSVYTKIKCSNSLFTWTFNAAEDVIHSIVDSFRPAAKIIESPVQKVDKMMCSGLDYIENKVPSLALPPEMIIWEARGYLVNKVKPVNSIVLKNPLSEFAANKIGHALDAADRYVDRYLPQPLDQNGNQVADTTNHLNGEECRAMQTIHKGQRFSAKLKRGLSFRTRQEYDALRRQSTEAVHIVFFALELLLTNPREFIAKAVQLWKYLSKDEPENQSRPMNLEQLIALLSREIARRVVHVMNYVGRSLSKVPMIVVTQVVLVYHYIEHNVPAFQLVNYFVSFMREIQSDIYQTLHSLWAKKSVTQVHNGQVNGVDEKKGQ